VTSPVLRPDLPPPSLPPIVVAPRLARLEEGLVREGLGALVVSSRANVRYLSGFSGSAGVLVVRPPDAWLVTDGRYQLQATEELAGVGAPVEVVVAPTLDRQTVLAGLLSRRRASEGPALRVGLEADQVTWAEARTLTSALSGCQIVGTTGLVEGLRETKDAAELARLERAAAIADLAFGAVCEALAGRATRSERELAEIFRHAASEAGADGLSFPTICVSGPRSALPHGQPTDRVVGPGEPLTVDYGVVYDGYCSDATRGLSLGELADPELRWVSEVVAAAQAAGVAAVAAGVPAAAVDRVCREVIDDAGFAEGFVHGTGHGVGLEIHEAPSVAARSTATLGVAAVVTVEPGVYLAGRGGVRIEDTVVVEVDGARPLTTAPKGLVL